jgi:MFS family permease
MNLLKHNMRALFRFTFFSNVQPYYVVLVLYFAHILNSFTLGASVWAFVQVAQAVLEIPTGIVSDRLGRVVSMQVGALSSLAGLIIYALSPGYWVLLVGAALQGLSFAMFSGNNNALIYDSARNGGEKDEFHSFYAKNNIALEVGGIISAITGTALAAISYSLVLWISVVPQVLAVLVTFSMIEPPRHSPLSGNMFSHLGDVFRYYKKNSHLRMMSIASIIGGGVGGAAWNMMPAYYNQYVPLRYVGSMLSANYLWSTIGFKASDWFMKRFKPASILIFSEAYARIVSFMALVGSTVASPFVMMLAGITYGPSDTAKQHLLHEEFTDAQRATMDSLNSLVTSIVYALFLVLAGYLADRYSPRFSLLVCNICLLPVFFIYRATFKTRKVTLET